jgi:hypothetical protein
LWHVILGNLEHNLLNEGFVSILLSNWLTNIRSEQRIIECESKSYPTHEVSYGLLSSSTIYNGPSTERLEKQINSKVKQIECCQKSGSVAKWYGERKLKYVIREPGNVESQFSEWDLD